MVGVTDVALRRTVAHCGAPDVAWSEFVSAAGLARPERRSALLPMLVRRQARERHAVVQLFGRNVRELAAAAALVAARGAVDGIDVNCGCPARHVSGRQGAGAALIAEPDLVVHALAEIRQALVCVCVCLCVTWWS